MPVVRARAVEPDDSGAGQAAGMQSTTTITAENVAELGTILGIWAHPDDEAYLSGGLMALARDNGQRVVCVTATRGELGTPDPVAWPPDRLAAERTREMARCLDDPRRHASTTGSATATAAVRRPTRRGAVAQLCDVDRTRSRPDTVLTFGPDGVTGHPDHRTVSAWAGAAFERAAPPAPGCCTPRCPSAGHARWSALNDEPGRLPAGLPGRHPGRTAGRRPGARPGPRPARSGRWPRRRPRPPA